MQRPSIDHTAAKDASLLARLERALQGDTGEGVELSLELLTHPSPPVVARAAGTLGSLGARRAVGPLRALVSPQQPVEVATAAMRALGQLGGEEVWRTFEAILENTEDPLHRPLLDELVAIDGSPRLVQALKKNLFAAGYPFKVRVLEVLSRYRGPTVEALLREYLDEANESLAAAAAAGLVHFPSPANYRRLADRLQLGPWTVQVACLEALLAIEPRPATRDLVPGLECEHPEVVLRTLAALERTGESEAIPRVVALLNHPDWKVRERVARVLGATRDPRVEGDLCLLAEDRRAQVRAAAFVALRAVPGVDHEVWGRKAAADRAAQVRQEAPAHLVEAGGKDARNLLFDLLRDVSATVRERALEGLRGFELGGFEAMVSPLAKDPEPRIRTLARELLVELGAPSDAVHLERALELADAGDLTGAQTMLRRLSIDRPEDTRVLYELARLCRRLEDPGEAEVYLRQVLKERPEHVGARKHLAEALLEQGRRSEACEQLRAACGGDPTNWKLWTQLGELSLEQGMARAAAGAYEKALDLHSSHLPSRRGLARAYQGCGNPEGALREWTALHERDPADPEPLFERGCLQLRRGDAASAASDLARARELGRADAPVLGELADALDAMGAHREAVEVRERVLAGGPGDQGHRLKLAEGYLVTGDPARARAVVGNLLAEVDATPAILSLRARIEESLGEFEVALDTRIQLVGMDDEFPGAQRAYAQLLRRMGRYDQAREAFRRHLDREPLDLEARRKLIELELLAGRGEAALTLIRGALEHHPDDAELSAQAARIHMGRSQLEPALEYARQATRLAPASGEYRVLLGDLLLKAGADEGARETYEHAMELGVDDPTLRLCIGRLYLDQRQPAKALVHLEKAAQSELEGSVELQLAMGRALFELSRHDRARGWLARARRTGDARAHRLLAELEVSHGDARDALDHVRALRTEAPDDEALPWLEGRTRRLLGEPGAAMAQLEKALETSPGDPEVVSELAACYLALGQHRKVTELYPGSPLLPSDDPDLRVAKGSAQLALGNAAKAVALARRMVDLDPDLVAARALLARGLRTLGDLAAAEEAVTQGMAIDPDAPALIQERAALYLAREHFEAALVDARRGLELPDRDPAFFLLAAEAERGAGRPAMALEPLGNYLLRVPTDPAGHRLKATCLRQLGRTEEAVEAWKDVVERGGRAPEAHLELADLLLELRRPEEAAERLQRYLETDGDKAPALRRLAQIREADGELEDAAACLRQLCEVEDGEFARFKLLELLLRRKDLGAAWPILERSVESYPELPRRLGEELRDRGDIALARDLFGFALQRDPHDLVAAHESAVCHYRLGAYDAARRGFERVIARRPLHAGAHHYLGLLEMLGGRQEGAVPHLEKAVEGDRANVSAVRHLAQIHLGAGRTQQALDVARLGLESLRGDRELLLVAGAACEALGHDDEALKAYRIAGRQRVDERSHLSATRLALKHGQGDLARQLGEELHGARPEDATAMRLLARAAAADGDPARAADVLESLWGQGDATLQDLRTLGRAASACQRLELASRAVSEALTMEAAHAETWLLLGHIELHRGRHHDAIEAYRHATRLEPRSADAWRGLGEALAPQARFREALEPAERAVELRPADLRGLHLLGRVQLGLGNPQKAREALEGALGLPGPEELKDRIRLELSDVLRRLGEAGNAKRILEQLPVSHGRDVARNVTEIAFEAQDYAAAAHHAKAYLAEHPEEPGILELLGRSLVELGMDKQARACLERHLALFGTPIQLTGDLARGRIARGQPGEAVQLLVQGLEKEPHSAVLWRTLAEAREARRDLEGAQKALERSLEYGAHDLEGLRALGSLYARRGEWDKARALYGEAVRTHPYEVDLHLGLGEALQAQSQWELAVERFQKAVEVDRRSAAAHRGLGLALARLGQRERAIESLKRAVQVDPADIQALHALARAHRDRGEPELARVVFERLVQVARPGSPEARAAKQYLNSPLTRAA